MAGNHNSRFALGGQDVERISGTQPAAGNRILAVAVSEAVRYFAKTSSPDWYKSPDDADLSWVNHKIE